MQGNLIFTDCNGNALPEGNEEDENYDPDNEDQENIPLILPNDSDDLDNEINDIAGVDYISEAVKENNENFRTMNQPKNTNLSIMDLMSSQECLTKLHCKMPWHP